MHGQAAVLRKNSEPLIIEELEYPKPVLGQVLVKIAYTGICRSQIMEIDGLRGPDKFIPHLMGHEASGIVIEVGTGVQKVEPGDHVVISWIRGNGLISEGIKLKGPNDLINAGPVTTFSEYSLVSENCVFKINKNFPLKSAALFGCAIPTGAGMVLNQLPTDLSELSIAVFGLGGIGLSAIQALRSRFANRIFAVDIDQNKLEEIKHLTNVTTIDASEPDYLDRLKSLNSGNLVDYSIDATGTTKGIMEAFASIKNFGGLCIFASHPKYGEKVSLDPFDLISGKQIKGSWGGDVKLDSDLNALFDLFFETESLLYLLQTREYDFENINEAILDFRNSKVTRPLIKIGGDL
jgi:S-(hydroxymethyl)glutathione dehydrogenase / alcohol dehydrogenase